jgi:hypothetical protein
LGLEPADDCIDLDQYGKGLSQRLPAVGPGSSRAFMTQPFWVGSGPFRGGAVLLRSGLGGIWSEVPVMRSRIMVRRFVAAIVLAVTVIAAALAVAAAAAAHHSLADNGVISSRN